MGIGTYRRTEVNLYEEKSEGKAAVGHDEYDNNSTMNPVYHDP